MNSPHPEPLILPLDSLDATLERVGGKGASLARLASAGLPVPPGFHVTTAAYLRFVDENGLTGEVLAAAAEARPDDPASLDIASARIGTLFAQAPMPADIAAAVRDAYLALAAGEPAVAGRSSATAEDLPEMSFAGQQETYLNVRGADGVLDAVQRCWASLWTARAIGYRARQGVPSDDVSLAVVVQALVPADAAGILFTANPISGARDETVINAAWGLGEAIVGGLVTPDTLVVDTRTGRARSEEIADKEVMTVRTGDGTREEPVPDTKRRQAVLDPGAVADLTRIGEQIGALYGRPMDIEWAIEGGRISVLQARPITALPEPRPTLDWRVPREGGRYARSSVIELLPDPLSPAFATVALPLWNEALREVSGALGLKFELMTLVTINGYAFYDFGYSTSQTVRLLAAMAGKVPLLFRMMGSAQTRWADVARPNYEAAVNAWNGRDLGATPATELLDGTHAVVQTAGEHYVAIQSGILPVAYITEALFAVTYDRLARRGGDPTALTFMLGFDSEPIRAEKTLFDIATWVRTQPELAAYLARTEGPQVTASLRAPAAPIADTEAWQEFSHRFADYLQRFGHSIYDLDFAKQVPADDPAPLVEALRHFLGGQGRDPHERQAAAEAARRAATDSLLARLGGLRRRLFTRLLGTAQRYAPLREDALADVGLGWPLVRRMLAEVGRRLAAAGAVDGPEDAYWLTWQELQAAAHALDAGEPPPDHRAAVAERRAAWARERRVTPPVTLPLKDGAKFMGIDFSRVMPAHTSQPEGDTIRGIGASPGIVAGVARVVGGPEEFGTMRPGDILVARITTPAWTPLFALAAGIVTDVGGPLSHSSIVAREYHIPAVLGTGVATERIASGRHIAVDGDIGVVTLVGGLAPTAD